MTIAHKESEREQNQIGKPHGKCWRQVSPICKFLTTDKKNPVNDEKAQAKCHTHSKPAFPCHHSQGGTNKNKYNTCKRNGKFFTYFHFFFKGIQPTCSNSQFFALSIINPLPIANIILGLLFAWAIVSHAASKFSRSGPVSMLFITAFAAPTFSSRH